MCSQAAILGKGELERMVSNEWREGAPHELPSVDLDVVGVGAGVGGAEAALPDFTGAIELGDCPFRRHVFPAADGDGGVSDHRESQHQLRNEATDRQAQHDRERSAPEERGAVVEVGLGVEDPEFLLVVHLRKHRSSSLLLRDLLCCLLLRGNHAFQLLQGLRLGVPCRLYQLMIKEPACERKYSLPLNSIAVGYRHAEERDVVTGTAQCPLLIYSLGATQVSMNANIGAARGEFGPLDGVGTYHGLRRKHVDTYLNEFVFRLNRRYHRKASFETPN